MPRDVTGQNDHVIHCVCVRVYSSLTAAVGLRLATTPSTTMTSDHVRRVVTWPRRRNEACTVTSATTDRPHWPTQRTLAACRLTATAFHRDARSSRNLQHTIHIRLSSSWGSRLWVPAAAPSVDSSWLPTNEFCLRTPAPISAVVPPTLNESRSVSSLYRALFVSGHGVSPAWNGWSYRRV